MGRRWYHLKRALSWKSGGVQASYAGAQVNRLTADWYASLLSSDAHIKMSLRTLRARSRQLVRDNPYAGSYVNLLKANIVGVEGVRLQSRLRAPDNQITPALRLLNQHIEDRWADWGETGICTVDGRMSFDEAQDLYLTNIAIDGECLIRHHDGYDNEFGYAIQFLDPDQLDETYCTVNPDTGNDIRMGVEVDRFNRAIAYWLWDRHPQDLVGFTRARERMRVPAAQIEHRFLSQRTGQTRGVPWTATIMFRLNMVDGYDEAEITAARSSSSNPVFFEVMPEFQDLWLDADKDAVRQKPIEMDIEPGMATRLPVGLRANAPDATHPTSAYSPFIKTNLRAIAAGWGVSYNALAQDLENVNYSSLRGGSIQERDTYKRGQRLVGRGFCRPVFRRWLPMASLTGAVTLPSMEAKRWMRDHWQPRGFQWVDPLNDMQAAQLGISLGLTTRTKLAAENGTDFEDNLRQLADEQRMADDLGVDISGERVQVQPRQDAPTPKNDGTIEDDEDGTALRQIGSRRPQLLAAIK